MTRVNQILDALQAAPATSASIARSTGMPPKTASSKLSELFWMGALEREKLEIDGKGVPPYLYRVKA